MEFLACDKLCENDLYNVRKKVCCSSKVVQLFVLVIFFAQCYSSFFGGGVFTILLLFIICMRQNCVKLLTGCFSAEKSLWDFSNEMMLHSCCYYWTFSIFISISYTSPASYVCSRPLLQITMVSCLHFCRMQSWTKHQLICVVICLQFWKWIVATAQSRLCEKCVFLHFWFPLCSEDCEECCYHGHQFFVRTNFCKRPRAAFYYYFTCKKEVAKRMWQIVSYMFPSF